MKFSRAVSRARERDGASASASRASISRARRQRTALGWRAISGAPNPEFIASAPYLATIRARDGDFDRRFGGRAMGAHPV